MRRTLSAFAAIALLATPVAATAQSKTGGEMAEMMRQLGLKALKGRKLDKAIEKASAFALGSQENPVRASAPTGQRAYLDRLRCADGKAPVYNRVGNVGPGIYGYIVDWYSVQCAEQAAVSIYMDMYHDHVEAQPVAGFTIVPEAVIETTA